MKTSSLNPFTLLFISFHSASSIDEFYLRNPLVAKFDASIFIVIAFYEMSVVIWLIAAMWSLHLISIFFIL